MNPQRPNSGILFRNDRKTTDRHPDYQGECDVNGKLMRISAWTKHGKRGEFWSLSFSEPRPKDDTGAYVPSKPKSKIDDADVPVPDFWKKTEEDMPF